MEISKTTLFMALVCICCYLYLADTFRQPKFQQSLRNKINDTIGNYTSHSVVDWVENRANSLAAFVSVSSSYIRDPRKVIFGAGVAIAGLALKWNNFAQLGGFFQSDSYNITNQSHPKSDV